MKKIHHEHPFGNICGSTSIGIRGQIVIPKKARDLMRVKTGDQFLVLEHDGCLVIVPEKVVSHMLKHISKALVKK
ncbi:MAG: AbrB family transcriptional regulator [Candidatus Magasanikbacteria bacterium CG10_big_fil_rev_8_21_14_0_10_36_32]|uniref:AbrB family transcriptional regulator n=1 Tax=Candidatus Magasanikbacteria bacterium CG10_big_fil_rev_8_21_14_0_10_36_32 TaxID=1974646 RepID=A0A2M6W5D8_9BACT|nr:MAG: AbrB family transcriptional regulator [Candidatus Magasanikbacteria bacterium CG10_big_fil_rev_8_21_14_0_10_36_32]